MNEEKPKDQTPLPFRIPQQVLGQLADRIAHAVVERMPKDVFRRRRKAAKIKKIDHALLLDTSAIIDGRIYEVAKLGFLSGNVVLADFILLELKHVADTQDPLKRARGRMGLELLDKLRKIKGITFKVFTDTKSIEGKDTDERLLRLTKKMKGSLITCDYNLNKKASVENIKVLNVNELTNALKVVTIPGEELTTKVITEGRGKNQGVGYLTDGTMIVVEDGVGMIGKEIHVVVSRVLQTAAGRMIFAKLKT